MLKDVKPYIDNSYFNQYYSNQLYRLYCGKLHIGYIRIPNRPDMTLDLFPHLSIISEVPVNFWRAYSNGKIHYRGAEVMDWIKDRVTPSGRHGIDAMLRNCGVSKYEPVALFVSADGKFTQDKFHIVPCDDEPKYIKLLKLDSFKPTKKSIFVLPNGISLADED